MYGIKFVITFIVCLVLMVGTAISGLGRYETQMRDERHIVTTNLGSLAEASDWRDAGEEGVKIVKPANKLGIFSSGLENAVGRTATVKEDDFPHMEDSIYSTAPIFAVFGEIDLTFIIQTVISLFAILFTYDMVSGEKERGTLRQCLSNPVPRNTYILGKSIGSFISLLIPFALPLLLSLLIILVVGGIQFSGDEWIRLALIIGGYVLYMLAFFSLGLLISTVTKNSAISFLVLLFAWVLLVLVIPKGSMMIANQVHPIPGINDVRADQFKLRENFNSTVWRRIAEEFDKAGGMSMDRSQRFAFFRQTRSEIRDELEPDFLSQNKKLIDDFKREQSNLTNLAMNLSRISPASAITYIGMNLSATGYEEQENFLSQLSEFREEFTNFIELEMEKEQAAMASGRGFRGRMTAAQEQGTLEVERIPKFEYRPLELGDNMEAVLPDYASLIILSIVLYLLAFINFLKYDVR